MKRLFSQLFKRSVLLCFGLASAFCAHAMITNVSEVNYVNEAGDKEKTILIFGYSADDEGFMGLNAQKKDLKSFFEKFETNGQSVDLLIQNNANLPEKYIDQRKNSFFYDFYKKTNTSSFANKVKIENFDISRKCIEQTIKTALKDENSNAIKCKLSDFEVDKNNEYVHNEFKNYIANAPDILTTDKHCELNGENLSITPTEESYKKIYNIEKLILCFDLSNVIENKIENSINNTIIVHCQDDCRDKYVSHFSQYERYKDYTVTSSTFKDYFDEASTKQKKSGEELSKKSGWEKIKNKFISFVNKYRLLPVVGVMAILGAAYLYFK